MYTYVRTAALRKRPAVWSASMQTIIISFDLAYIFRALQKKMHDYNFLICEHKNGYIFFKCIDRASSCSGYLSLGPQVHRPGMLDNFCLLRYCLIRCQSTVWPFNLQQASGLPCLLCLRKSAQGQCTVLVQCLALPCRVAVSRVIPIFRSTGW